jgi:hypothetical protein
MRNDLRKIIQPQSEPSPTIGGLGLKLHLRPLRRKVDFYDTAGRLHGLIVLVPVLYGAVQTYRHVPLQPWYWYSVLATLAFAIFARRSPFLRLSPAGISFPEKKSRTYAWEQMAEAHARDDELDILMSDGEHVTISYRNMRQSDIDRVKKLIKQQFQVLAARAAQTPAPVPAAKAA